MSKGNGKSDLIEVGALWSKTSKKGTKFLSGKFSVFKSLEKSSALAEVLANPNAYQLTAFKNIYKEKENQPDFRLYASVIAENGAPKKGFARNKFSQTVVTTGTVAVDHTKDDADDLF